MSSDFTLSCAVACNSSCVGLMRCVSPGPTLATQSCCNYFDMTGSCVEACPANSSPSAQFECECDPGFMLDAPNSCMEINECESNPCQNGGTCVDEVNSFSCVCVADYTGTNCTTSISDCSVTPCQNGGTCQEDRRCVCPEQFTGEDCSGILSSFPCIRE